MPFPRFVGPISLAATFGHNERRIDEAFFFIQCASVAKLVSNVGQNPTQNLVAAPSLKASMHSFVVRIALRQHVPLRTCVEYPQHRFQHMTSWNRFTSRRPSGICSSGKCFHVFPLFVRQPNHSSFIADRQQSEFYCQLQSIALTYASHAVPLQLDFSAFDHFAQLFAYRGQAEAIEGRRPVGIQESQSFVASRGDSFRLNYGRTFEQLVLRINPTALVKKLEAVGGDHVVSQLKFNSSTIRPEYSESLRQMLLFGIERLDCIWL